jgi:hypothetical protein
LNHTRRLRTLVDRQARFGSVPTRHHRAWLKSHASVTPEDEMDIHNLIRTGKRGIDGTGIKRVRSKARLSPSVG